jgi:prepilin-type N-terminal cleavage/methylation domain-containing protein
MSRVRSAPFGFTLIELMIVVAIIGILASIAIPNFVKFSCRAKQTEAKTNLTSIFVAEEAYRAEFDTYFAPPDEAGLIDIGVQFRVSPKKRYNYRVAAATGTTFNAIADGIPGLLMEGDQWEIQQSKVLTWNTSAPDCR